MGTGRRKGFSVMEFLVVIAIIMILAAILFPVFDQARDRARQGACISHLRQIAAAIQLYCEDDDHHFPLVLARNGGDEPAFPDTWMGSLRPYVKSAAVFLDPASGHRNPDWRASGDLLANYSFPPLSQVSGRESMLVCAEPYGTAMWEGLGGFSGPATGTYREPAASYSHDQVARPGETIMICDQKAFDWGFMTGHFYYPDPRHRKQPDLLMPDGNAVPQGLIEAAFVDGHVQTLRHEQFWEILPHYSKRVPGWGVFRYFWPYE